MLLVRRDHPPEDDARGGSVRVGPDQRVEHLSFGDCFRTKKIFNERYYRIGIYWSSVKETLRWQIKKKIYLSFPEHNARGGRVRVRADKRVEHLSSK